jgi:hypothetical protein
MRIGILEYRDNDFIKAVAEGLKDLDVGFIALSEIHHPSPSPYRVVIDRVSFADPFLREVMRYWSLCGAYVLNNPFYTLTADKLSDILVCGRLGIPHPRTVLLPKVNLAEDMREIVSEPDWEKIRENLPFPCIIKPVDGYAWQDVFRADTLEEMQRLYENLKRRCVLLAQEYIPWTEYYRAFCIDRREVLLVSWTPKPLDMGEYRCLDSADPREVISFISRKTAEFNAAVGLDFNSIEWCVTAEGKAYIIDSYNDVPDVRKDKIPDPCYRWIVDRFCACVRRILASGEKNSLTF